MCQSSLLPSPGEAKRCPEGITGIVSARDAVCCPLGCNKCGGPGCSTSGKDSGLGGESCCASIVMASEGLCSETGEAPCVLDGSTTEPAEQDTTEPSGFSGGQYGEEYTGEGTYYGHTTEGNCAFFNDVPDMYEGMIAGGWGSVT